MRYNGSDSASRVEIRIHECVARDAHFFFLIRRMCSRTIRSLCDQFVACQSLHVALQVEGEIVAAHAMISTGEASQDLQSCNRL